MSKNYPLRGITDDVDAAIQKLFAGEPTRGSSAPRQSWLVAQINISALGLDLAEYAYALWQASQRIARNFGRNAERDNETLNVLFFQSFVAFDNATKAEKPGQMANCLYYLVLVYAIDGNIRDFRATLAEIAERAEVAPHVALRVAAAKYHDRSRRPAGQKNEPAEQKAMQRVLQEEESEKI